MKKIVLSLALLGSFTLGVADVGREAISKCDQGDAASCKVAGLLYFTGVTREIDNDKAFNYFKKGCDGDDKEACSYLGQMYLEGKGTKQDAQKAVEAFDKSCRNGDSLACTNLGIFYLGGIGVKKDVIKGAAYLRKACGKDDWHGCAKFAMYLDIAKDTERAKEFYKKACDLGKKDPVLSLADPENFKTYEGVLSEAQIEAMKKELVALIPPGDLDLFNSACDRYDILK